MNIVFLTVEERIYFPPFFARVLQERAADTRAVFMCPLKHGRQSTLQMIAKYQRAFGWWNTLQLTRREVSARIADRLSSGGTGERFHSIASVARRFDVPCEIAEDVNSPAFHDRLRRLNTDLIVSVGCPQIFRKPLIELPPNGCINIHGSLLPRYRGLSPSFWMMLNDEKEAGVTVFFVHEAIDLGDAILQESFPMLPGESLEQFIIRSRKIHAEVLLKAITLVERNEAHPWTLRKEEGTYFSFPTRKDYREFRRRGKRMW